MLTHEVVEARDIKHEAIIDRHLLSEDQLLDRLRFHPGHIIVAVAGIVVTPLAT